MTQSVEELYQLRLLLFRQVLCNETLNLHQLSTTAAAAAAAAAAPTTTTATVLRPFVWDYQGEPVPEETLTHPPS